MARVLIVDDNDEMRRLLAEWLRRKNHQPICAHNAPSALLLVKTEKPDVVLVDLNMPVVDGFELTQRLRQIDEGKRIPIIAVTARVMTRDRTRALEVGCDDYEPKPVNFVRLGRKIEDLLAKTSNE